MTIWTISDTHFGHENILKFKDKGGNLIRGSRFSSVTEMDECMCDNWNDTVQDGDTIYHLGDVYFGNTEKFLTMFRKLKGKKKLILGNHDNAKVLTKNNVFNNIQVWRQFPEFGVLLSHVPVHIESLNNYRNPDNPYTNVHGHLHQNNVKQDSDRYVCVSVEQTDYKPVNLEEAVNK